MIPALPPRLFTSLVAPCLAVILSFPVFDAQAAACKEPQTGTDDAPMLSPPLGKAVVGTGRLQFFSAPDVGCAMKGVFVVPRDDLTAYAETSNGWSSVLYINPHDGNSVQGWVRSERLRTTGTDGPRQ